MSNHSSALPTVAAAIWSAPLAGFGVGGTSGSNVAALDKKTPGSEGCTTVRLVAGAYMSRNTWARTNVAPSRAVKSLQTPFATKRTEARNRLFDVICTRFSKKEEEEEEEA
jgi:hypothetical protein